MATGDLFLVQEQADGTFKRVQLQRNFAEIYTNANTTTQALTASTADILTNWTANGEANGLTPSYSTDRITVSNDGKYFLAFSLSFEGNTGVTYEFAFKINGTTVKPNGVIERKTGNGDVGRASCTAVLALSSNDYIQIEVTPDSNSANFTVREAVLDVFELFAD